MRRRALLAAGAALTALIAVPAGAQAGLGGITSHEASPGDHAGTHDVRSDTHLAPTDAQIEAARQLVTGAGQGTRVTWDDRFGTPRTILRYGDPLSGPQAGSPAEVARSWLDAHRGAFGLTAGDVTALELTQSHELTGTGTRVVNFVQTFASGSSRVQAVRGGSISVAVRQDGRILSYAGTAVRHAGLTGSYDLSAGQALEKVAGTLAPGTDFAAEAVGQKAGYTSFARGPFGAGSYVQKAGFPTAQGVRAAYQVLFVKAPDQAWDTVIDAGSGEILYRADLVAHESEGTVFENFPGAPRGGNPVIKPFGPTEESPAGYTDPTGLTGVGGPTTFGNNANSYANYSNFLVPADEAPRPVSATSQFNFSYSQNWARTQGQEVPPSYVEDLNPAATNLFFQHNRIHDEFYRFGFTESAGNFQVNNNGNGGEQGDPVLGLVHAGATTGGEPTFTGRDNAYM
ncbi:MAG: M36 family metallopeptidase, partial [Streptomycetales bacterium]